MNNSGMSRRPAGPVRQHSLQQPPRRQQQIRRQRSSEDEKSLQIYSSTVSSRSRFSSNKCDPYNNQLSANDRPKVRVAWGDHQPSKSKNEVEIVARQIPTGKSSRPTTGRAMRRCPLAEKATFLYSRQELAERLRLAWRQREENKSNIDIFLAHNTVEERSESRLSTMTNGTVTTPNLPKKQAVEDKVRIQDEENEKINGLIDEFQPSGMLEYQAWYASSDSNESTSNDTLKVDVAEDENKENIETPNAEDQDEDEGEEEVAVIEKKSSLSINCNDWNSSITINNKSEVEPTTPTIKEQPDYSTAKLKRAGFQSGLNKAFNTPINDNNKSSTPRITSRVSTCHDPARFRRTNSAPPQRRTQVNIVIDAPGISSPSTPIVETPNVERPRAMSANTDQNQKNRPVKSVPPVKRRSKINKRRGLSVAYSKDGEDDTIDGKGKTKGGKGGKNAMVENKSSSGDVITMVSLISSADSESEMDENSPRDDKLISELRSKLPTTPIIKSSNGLSGGIRKPFKSVSFQQDSFDYDSPPPSREDTPSARTMQARFAALSKAVTSNSDDNTSLITAMTSWKMESVQCPSIGMNPLSMSSMLLQQQEAPTIETPLTDREKRCLAVPIGDVLDKKRKLVRCRSAVVTTRDTSHDKQSADASQTCLQTEMRLSQIASHITVNLQENISSKPMVNISVPTAEMSEIKTKPIPSEPYCQTPKEKECWHLYKKMCDKGVFVSFDTVLRGMLTPTEYRLRQKEVSQNC